MIWAYIAFSAFLLAILLIVDESLADRDLAELKFYRKYLRGKIIITAIWGILLTPVFYYFLGLYGGIAGWIIWQTIGGILLPIYVFFRETKFGKEKK